MRVTHVNHRYRPFVGGSERYVQEVAEALACAGNVSRVVTTNAFDLEYFWNARKRAIDAPTRETLNEVAVTRTRVRHYPFSPLIFQGGRRALGEASRVARLSGPFRLAANWLPWIPDLQAAIAADGPNDLIAATNLGLEGLALTALRAARSEGAAFALLPFIHLGSAGDRVARRYVSMPHQLELLRAADIVLVMTPTEAEFVHLIGVPATRIYVVGAGIEPDEVTGGCGARFRERYGIRGALVGALGALAPDKGTPHLAQAVIALRRRGHDVTLALAGPALGRFERWFGRLTERDRAGVRVLGVVDAETKRDMLSAVDLLALPSRTESFGIVFLEAWANAKPVIAADAGAVTDLVRDHENGLLTPFGDVDAIANAILELLANASLRSRLGAAGRAMTLENYTWPTVVARVGRAYGVALGTTSLLEAR